MTQKVETRKEKRNLKKSNLLDNYYKNIIVEELLLKLSPTTVMEIPTIEKITINTSSKSFVKEQKTVIPSLLALEIITAQKGTITKAKNSIATFKLREGQLLGCKCTLRKEKMFLFFDKLRTIIFPRLRDFGGVSKNSFDSTKNYTLGIQNLMIFPELENYFEFFEQLTGMNITFTLQVKNQKVGELLMSSFQLPLSGRE